MINFGSALGLLGRYVFDVVVVVVVVDVVVVVMMLICLTGHSLAHVDDNRLDENIIDGSKHIRCV